jgi:hypothetical protein
MRRRRCTAHASRTSCFRSKRDKFASNTFVVPSPLEAKGCLCRAGFRAAPRYPALLIDRQTGRLIRLTERRTAIQGDSSL